MTTIKSLLTLIILSCFLNVSFAQTKKVRRTDHRNSKTKTKNRINRNNSTGRNNTKVYAKRGTSSSRKGMTSSKYLWLFPSNGSKGRWVSLKSGELNSRLKLKAKYSYNVNSFKAKAYGQASSSYLSVKPPAKKLDVKKVTNNYDNLKNDIVKNFSMGDKKKGRPTVYYFNKINLNNFLCASNKDLIIVVDTLFVPAAKKGNNALSSLWYDSRNYIKVVANCIVYESPVRLISSSRVATDFVFSANKFIFKSPYKNLSSKNLNPSPPFYLSSGTNAKGYKNPMTEKEKILLNRLYANRMYKILDLLKDAKISEKRQDQLLAEYENIAKNKINKRLAKKDWKTQVVLNRTNEGMKLSMNRVYANKMKKILTKLNATSNIWKVDQLLEDFQNIRRNKIIADVLENDDLTNSIFNESCEKFQDQYGDKGVQELRKEGDIVILVSGEVERLDKTPFKYYTLPSKANLIPVNDQATGKPTALGFVTYSPTGDSKLELNMEVALSFDRKALKKVTKKLKKNGLKMEKVFPVGLASIDEQPLKVNGKTIGKIIPIGNQNVRFEIKLEEEGLTLLQLFSGNINFKIDYEIDGHQEPYSQHIDLGIKSSLLENITEGEILESFSVIEMSSMSDAVKISSQLDAGREDEGALNFVEVTLEFNFQNETRIHGPIRFSSYSTHASEMTIPFLKYSDSYSVKVKGYADYENGRRDIKVFSENSKIIVLDEGIFE